MDLEALVTDELRDESAGYGLEWYAVSASSRCTNRLLCSGPLWRAAVTMA